MISELRSPPPLDDEAITNRELEVTDPKPHPEPSRMQFDQLVLSGGGTRCFWQAGFLNHVRDEMQLAPKRLCCVSGGAMTAAGFVAGIG
ncbi:MAG: patatin-like phospholipase family protein, partial [Parvularcula sp.]|nr:patatin-like phospholipase family protein [Parvularcula sp.]